MLLTFTPFVVFVANSQILRFTLGIRPRALRAAFGCALRTSLCSESQIK